MELHLVSAGATGISHHLDEHQLKLFFKHTLLLHFHLKTDWPKNIIEYAASLPLCSYNLVPLPSCLLFFLQLEFSCRIIHSKTLIHLLSEVVSQEAGVETQSRYH
jgi:hypothetical protein